MNTAFVCALCITAATSGRKTKLNSMFTKIPHGTPKNTSENSLPNLK